MKNVKTLLLGFNKLCSLPSEIALMTTVEMLNVRLSKRSDRDLTIAALFQVEGNQLTSLPPELGLLTNLKWLNVRQSRQ
jgi:Leucine-rich repeat (LRR) protein